MNITYQEIVNNIYECQNETNKYIRQNISQIKNKIWNISPDEEKEKVKPVRKKLKKATYNSFTFHDVI